MAQLVLFIVSVLPVALLGMFIYKKDKEKESTKLLIKLFVGGILSCLLVIIISAILELIFPFFSLESENLNLLELIIYVFVGIALVEEVSKWIFVYKFSFNDKAFNEAYDMILYAGFVALGFACFENLLYVYQNGITTGLIRAISAVPSHLCDGVFMGYYLSLAKISLLNKKKDLFKKNLILSIIVPIVLHGIYDYCLFTGNGIFAIIFLVFIILMYIYAFRKIKQLSSIRRKIKYQDNYCPNCGTQVNSNFCPTCGRKND